MRVLITLGGLLVMVALVPGHAAAQEITDCGLVDDDCTGGPGYHVFDNRAPWSEPDAEGTGEYHWNCLPCFVSGVPSDDPLDCHPTCIENEEDQEEFELLAAAADQEDFRTILQATVDRPHFARLNLERGSVQLFGCEEQLIANIPIDAATIEEWQQELSPTL